MRKHLDMLRNAKQAAFASGVRSCSLPASCIAFSLLLLLSLFFGSLVLADDAGTSDPVEAGMDPAGDPEADIDVYPDDKKRLKERERERLMDIRDREAEKREQDESRDDGRERRDRRDRRDDKDHALDHDRPDKSFDGGQFKKPDFIDTDFHKRMYRDSFRTDLDSVMSLGPLELFDDAMKRLTAADDRVFSAHDDDLDTRDRDPDAYTYRELRKPIDRMLHDWVPSDPDPVANGAFAIDEDNGRPVPYRLNGHLDFQRGLPWLPSD